MSNNKYNKGVYDFRQTLADLIRLNDERGRKRLGANPASRSLHPKHQPAHLNSHADGNKPTTPRQVAKVPHPAAPLPQYRHPALRAPMPTRSRNSREEIFERRMSSLIAQHNHDSSAGSGIKAPAGLFASGLLVVCCATFALVYYLASEDRVTAASSHYLAPATAQATLGISSPVASNNTTSGNHTAAANAQAQSKIADGSWIVRPSDVKKQVQAAGQESPGSATKRQELFESFQKYLQETGIAPVTDSAHQEALFNSFVRWNMEVADAN